MYIKEIILEGFKTYSVRTVIKGFDPQFNAITGFNGSGKSNILDAILFVLGINKEWDTLRVKQISELIYKLGHAGITKAEVTIVFDNHDKDLQPSGYEQWEEITVTRQVSQNKSKYFVNGTKEPISKVKNMFRSVQLNVDNPHFLVAQGKITRIINLKPQELSGYLEETAGTALYNEKKRESQKIIQKKEEKVNEINDLLKNEIEPQMDKLRREREQYFLWKSGEKELQRLNKLLRGYEYYNKKGNLDDRMRDLQICKEQEQERKKENDKLKSEVIHLDAELKTSIQQKTKDADVKYKQIEDKYNEVKADLNKKQSDRDNLNTRIIDGEKEINQLKRTKNENENAIIRIDKKLDYDRKTQNHLQQILNEKKDQQDEALRQMEQMKKGQSNIDDIKQDLKRQINDNITNQKLAKSEIEQIDIKIAHLEKEIQSHKENFQNAANEGRNSEKESDILKKEMDSLEKEILDCQFNENDLNALKQKKQQIDQNMMEIKHKLDMQSQGNNWIFKLNFKDPEPNFDKSKVKGRVFQLFKAMDQKYLKALEVGAGFKLQNIVIDNEITGKLLFKKNCFTYQVTFIPNNKIVYKQASPQVIQFAEKVARECNGFAYPAHQVIQYDESISQSILYVFGGFFICSSSEIAKRIAFNNQQFMRYKCVTLDGDIHDPSGTLTGGYINQNQMILTRYEEFRQVQDEMHALMMDSRRLEETIQKMEQDQEYYNGLRRDIDKKKYKYEKLQTELRRKSGLNMQDRIENMSKDIDDLREQRQRTSQLLETYQKEYTEVDQEFNQISDNKNAKDVWGVKVNKLKDEIKKINQEMKTLRDKINQLEVEKENCDKEIEKCGKNIQKEEKTLTMTRTQLDLDQNSLKTLEQAFKTLTVDKERMEKEMRQVDIRLTEIETKRTALKSEQENVEKEVKKIEQLIARHKKDINDLQDILGKLEHNFEFISIDKANFGVPGTEYDFTSFDYDQQQNRFNQLKHDQEMQQKKVNLKVEAMSEKVEKDYINLIEKRKILDNDKTILFQNIEELDKKKQETLDQCYTTVNKCFGEIFKGLLPGAFASIKPVNKEISEGLEINVSFNNIWKSSLSELSGGQRSLLALSFTLALLKYKPAPFYILDEVDSALDLSHTENIGSMLSSQFGQSQFLLISLKDGMYQNANVLFRVSFIEGVSKVDQIVLKSASQKKHSKKTHKMDEEEGNKENTSLRTNKK